MEFDDDYARDKSRKKLRILHEKKRHCDYWRLIMTNSDVVGV